MTEEEKVVEETTPETDDSSNVEETETPKETELEDDGPTLDDYQTLKAEKEKLEKLNKQLYARTKKLPPTLTQNNDLSRDEIILLTKGVSEDELNLAKALQTGYKAQGKDIKLTDIYETDPALVALKEKNAKEQRSKKASLGASGRSVQSDDSGIKEGMTREEHMEAWRKATQQ